MGARCQVGQLNVSSPSPFPSQPGLCWARKTGGAAGQSQGWFFFVSFGLSRDSDLKAQNLLRQANKCKKASSEFLNKARELGADAA